ncbi:RCC1 and BTB domain-containing protein 1 [Anthophora plagiata]
MFHSDLKNWPIFNMLEPTFISQIHMAIVYGDLANEALIVTKNGMVYGLGKNASGCLGTGDTESTLYPKKIDELCEKGIKTFACGTGPHVLALTEKGEVYSWGSNSFYQLGNADVNEGFIPSLIEFNLHDKVVVQIACGYRHSVALTDDGKVYAWGSNKFGQVGNKIMTNQNAPLEVVFPYDEEKIISISCGPFCSMAITDDGRVYSWGCYDGPSEFEYVYIQPIEIDIPFGIAIGSYKFHLYTGIKIFSITNSSVYVISAGKVVCGSSYILALSKGGVLYAWGKNEFGQLGLGHREDTCSPVKVEFPEMIKILDMAASHYEHISVAITRSRKTFIWGRCLGQVVTVPTVTNLESLHDALTCYAPPRIMHEPLIVNNEEESTSLVDSIREAFDDANTSDLVVEVQEKLIYVHKAILKIRSRYFKTMFETVSAEDNQSVIKGNQFSYEVYKAFLKYLYTDEIDVSLINLLELFKLAIAYSENHLKKRCVQMMKKHIALNNVLFLYNVAVENNIKELEEPCFKLALRHITAVVRTPEFLELNTNTLIAFITKAAQDGAFKT